MVGASHEEISMRMFMTCGLLFLFACGTAAAQSSGMASTAPAAPMAKVSELMTKALKDYPGKEAMMITVVYPPGSVDPVHRHNAHAFVYVLEGHIVMGLNGGKTVTLGPGQTFYEGPDDVHTVGRNASKTKPAKFVVFLLKDRNAPVLTPVH
jgi:quercetin dioxygenase-like cupin family protein